MSLESLESRLLLVNVSGHITSDTVWNDTSEPYLLVGNLTINPGVTLTLAPDVLLRSNSNEHNVFVDGRLEATDATIDLLYNYSAINNYSDLDIRSGGELILNGGQFRGAGRTLIRNGGSANLTDVNLAHYNGGQFRTGSPLVTYFGGSTGILDNATGTANVTINSSQVSVVNGIVVNHLTLNAPITVDQGTISQLTSAASATVTNSTIGFVNLNGGSPILTGNTITNSAPLRVTNPDNFNVAGVTGNAFTAGSPWIHIQGTLNGVRQFPIVDDVLGNYLLTGNMTIASTGSLTLTPGVLLRSDSNEHNVLVDGRLAATDATIDLLYNYSAINNYSDLDIRSGGELILNGGQLRGAGRTLIRNGGSANLTDVNLAHYNGGQFRTGSPLVTYFGGSTGILDNATGTANVTINSSQVSVVNGIVVNHLTLNAPITVDQGTISQLTSAASATVTNSTIGFVNLNGGSPILTGNTITNSAPLRVTNPDNFNVAGVTGNTFTAGSPWIHVHGTLNGVRQFPIVDDVLRNYLLTGNMTIASSGILTLAPGVLLRSDNDLHDIIVDGRIEGNGATIDLLYNYAGINAFSDLNIRSGGDLVLTGGSIRGPGLIHVRSGAQARLTNVNLAYYNGGQFRTGSPSLTFYSGSSGTLDGSMASGNLTVSANSVLVRNSQVNSINLSASATIRGNTLGFINLNGGTPTISTNTFTNSAPFRTTNPNNLNLGRVFDNSYTAVSPQINVSGTLSGKRTLNVIDSVVATYNLTGNMTVGAGGELTVGPGATLRVPDTVQLDVSSMSTFTNDGVVDVRVSANGTARLRFGANTVVDGRGEIRLNHNSLARIEGPAGAQLTVGPNQSLKGYGEVSVAVTNEGLIRADGSSRTLLFTRPLDNQGTLAARNGATVRVTQSVTNSGVTTASGAGGVMGTVDVDGDLTVTGQGVLHGPLVGGRILVGGNLLGDTMNADRFQFLGRVHLDGNGSSESPKLLEAMGRDQGPVAEGFVNNFTMYELRLDGANHVQLVDQASNSVEDEPEAVYVDRLIVASGATLDLNGLNLYARSSQVLGTVVGGTVIPIPDGGPIRINRITPGQISTSGEGDEWTFFGRAGRVMRAELNAGTSGWYPNLAPQLTQGQVELLDPNGTVVATSGTDVTLAESGVYRLRVSAASNQPSATGHYTVAIWDTTTSVTSLRFNQDQSARLSTPYSLDHWTFSAAAGTLVWFHLLDVDGQPLNFQLTGPDGWVGFQDLQASSGLITLPHSGRYVLTASTQNWQYQVDYSFRFEAVLDNDQLTLGVPYEGTIGGTSHSQFFRLDLSDPAMISVTLDDESPVNRNELYVKFGAPPTRADYDFRGLAQGSPDQSLIIPMATAGTWYVMVHSAHAPAPSSYSLLADLVTVVVDSVNPTRHGTSVDAVLTIRGAGFNRTASVELIAPDDTVYPATSFSVDSSAQITATFSAGTVPPALYHIRASRSDGGTSSLIGAFTFTQGGEAKLETNLVVPNALGYHQLATIYIEYTNSGDVAMPAPLLTFTVLQRVKPDPDPNTQSPLPRPPEPYWTIEPSFQGNIEVISTLQHHSNPYANYESWLAYYRAYLNEYYRQDAILTLDKARVKDGFWTSAMPDGFSNNVSTLAHGRTPGLLQPGEKGRIPVYWTGWLKPWDFSYPDFEFSLVETTTDDSTPMDWDYWKDQIRPESVSPLAWEPVWQNFVSQAGTTWGEYVSILARNAAYLGRLGQSTFDAGDLLALEVMQSGGALPAGFLEQAIDAAMSAPGLPLSLGRAFPNDVMRRNEFGPFGWGWTHSWDFRLETLTDGTVQVREPGLAIRIFQPDVRGGYIRQPGDLGTLRALSGGRFSLTEISGTQYLFRPDGLLDYVQDTHGNRITASYLNGRLSGLVHSGGASLSLEYTPQGRLAKVSDSTGSETIYGYDATGEHLLTVTNPSGITRYEYTDESSGPRSHALTKISYPGQLNAYFSYDEYGRLERTWGEDGANDTRITYGPAGEIQVTHDQEDESATTRLFFDHRRQVARVEDPLGRALFVGYDAKGNATTFELADGTRYSYQYDARGNVRRQTGPLGQLGFSYTTNFNQLSTVTDARGNRMLYEYDPQTGNLTTIRYQDGSFESYTYRDDGTLASWTNRRGQTVSYSHNYYPDGRLQQFQQVLPGGKSYTYSYTYDPAGDWLMVTDEIGATAGAMTFNHNTGWLERVEYPGGYWLAYQYYDSGLRSQLMDQDGHITNYVYDAVGRLDQLTDGDGTLIVDYGYDTAGRIVLETLGNGVYTQYSYDLASQLEQIITRGTDGMVIAQFDYTYNESGLRTSMATLDGVWLYEYDATGQLTHAAFTSANPDIRDQDLHYEYDAAGNRIQTVANGVVTSYVTDAMNRYLQVGDTTYEYDRDGNVISMNAGMENSTYGFDVFNRLVTVTTPSGIWEYEYDAFGNRSASIHDGQRTSYLNDPTGLVDIVAQFGESATESVRYVHGHRLVTQYTESGPAYYTHDSLGSTVSLVDSTGEAVNRYLYDPFGSSLRTIESIYNPFQFVGGLGVMETGHDWHFMRARYYDSEQGRFVSEDPIGVAGKDANLYRYAVNSPGNTIDPSGLTPNFPELWFPEPCYEMFDDSVFLCPPGKIACVSKEPDATGRHDVWVHPYFQDDLCVLLHESTHCAHAGKGWPVDGWSEIEALMVGCECERRVGFSRFSQCNQLFEPPEEPPTPPPVPNASVPPAASNDPNQKLGPGFGDAGYVTGNQLLNYRIDFENDPSATAPAQFVLITDQLDNKLDWTTFQITEVGFADELIEVPEGMSYFEVVVPYSHNDRAIEIHITIGIDLDFGEVRATFMTLDPDTGLPPDVTTGFLPPEDGTGRGQGFFAFTIQAVEGLPTGTEIRNIADIQFDFGDIIATNQVDPHDPSLGTDPRKEALITIDAGAPTSAVNPLPAVVSAEDLFVTWTGEDDPGGSGIKHYAIYVSIDEGPFEILLDRVTLTSLRFPVEAGHSYAFYTVASDLVGHREDAPLLPDARTYVNVAPEIVSLQVSPSLVERPANITLEALGTLDTDGTVVRVEFYRADELLGFDQSGDDGWSWTTSTEGWELGEHTLFARALDDFGSWSDWVSATVNVQQPQNTAPVADAGGPYVIAEGALIQLDASGTLDFEQPNDTLTYEWDLDYHGATFHANVFGMRPTLSFPDSFGARIIAVRVTDEGGLSDIAFTTLEVTNVAPTATLLDNGPVTYGEVVTLHFEEGFDPSSFDTEVGFRYAFALVASELESVTYATASTAESTEFLSLNAGEHTIYGRIIDKDDAYTQYSAVVVVAPAELTITVSNTTKLYGDDNPGFAVVYDGFVLEQDESVLEGIVAFDTPANNASAVGAYHVSASDVTSPNYAITFVDGILTVTPAPLLITADDRTRVYGYPNPDLTGTITGIRNQDVITVSYSTTAEMTSNAGQYPITAEAAGEQLGNYDATYVNGTLTVAPALLTITVNNSSKLQGQPNPEFSVSYSGFVLDQDESVLNGTLAFHTEADDSSEVGEYTVSASGLTSDNYAIEFVDGTLVVFAGEYHQSLLWGAPAPILFGMPLSIEQLSAIVFAEGPGPTGELSYRNSSGHLVTIGTLLEIGVHTLTVVAAATDYYDEVSLSVDLKVLKPYTISGMVFIDFNNDGEVDFGEYGIPDVRITLTRVDALGEVIGEDIVVTDEDGVYRFANLWPGNYYITESQPDGFQQGVNRLGTLGGSLSAVDQFFLELGEEVVDASVDTDAQNYNFAERPAHEGVIEVGQTAGIGFWQNKNGQSLIQSLNGGASSTQLANWLAATLPNMFGHLSGRSNSDVAGHFRTLFAVRGQKLEAQVMATALAVYVTRQSLGGSAGQAYGFTVTTYGVGNRVYNVGTNGAAFGVDDGSEMTILELLLATDAMTLEGILYHSHDASLMKSLRDMAHRVYSDIND